MRQIEKVVSFSDKPNNPTRIFPFKEITGRLADILDKSAVSFNNGSNWTNRELLQRLKVAPYPIEFTSPGKFRSSMIAATKMILDDEVLVELAKQEKLDKTSYVRDQVRIWREYLLYQAMVAKIYRAFSNDQTTPGQSHTENTATQFDKYLCSIADKYTIIINHSILDSLTLIKTDMAVIKQHFPVRSLIPLIQPLYQPSAFGSIISGKIIQI